MIELDVVTPERHMLRVSCERVALPGALGEFEVLEGHTPLLTGLKAGILVYESKTETSRIMVAEGFAEVGPNHVTVMCEGAAFASEVDLATEEKLIDELIKQKNSLSDDEHKEFKRVEAEIERSAAKIRLI